MCHGFVYLYMHACIRLVIVELGKLESSLKIFWWMSATINIKCLFSLFEQFFFFFFFCEIHYYYYLRLLMRLSGVEITTCVYDVRVLNRCSSLCLVTSIFCQVYFFYLQFKCEQAKYYFILFLCFFSLYLFCKFMKLNWCPHIHIELRSLWAQTFHKYISLVFFFFLVALL